METELERLVVRLTGNNAELIASLSESVTALQDSADSIEGELERIREGMEEASQTSANLSASLNQMGGTLVGIGSQISNVFGDVARSGLMLAGAAETNKIAFETMTGSADQAENILKRLTKFAAETPFEMPEIVQAARGLILFGERGEKLENTLVTLGNAASATSSSFGEVAMIFNQVRGKGKLQMEEFYQFSERGILSMQDLADHYKITTAEASAMISAGKVGFQDISDILEGLSGEGGRFEGMMIKQSKSLEGLWSTLTDSINLLKREIGDQFMPIAKDLLAWAIEWVDWLRAMPSDMKKIVALVIGLTTAVGMLLTFLGGMIIAAGGLVASYTALTIALGGTTLAAYATSAAMSALSAAPVIAITAAFVALGFAIYAGNADIRKFNQEMERANELTTGLSKIEQDATQKIFDTGGEMQEVDRKAYFEQQQLETDNAIAQTVQQLDKMKMKAEEAAPSILSLWQSGKKEYERLTDDAKQYGETLANLRTRSEALKDALKELGDVEPPPEFDPKMVKQGQDFIDNLNLQVVTFGKTGREAKILEMAYKDFPPAQLEMIRALDQELKLLEEKAAADKAAADAKNRLTNDIEKFTEGLKLQNATFSMTSNEAKLYALEQRGASEEALAMARAEAVKYQSLVDGKKATEESRRELEKLTSQADNIKDKLASPFEKFSKEVALAQTLLEKGLIDQGTFEAQVKSLEKEILDKEFKADLKLQYSGIEGIDAMGLDAAARVEEHRQRLQAAKGLAENKVADKIIAGASAVSNPNIGANQADTKTMADRLKKLVEIGEKQLKNNKPIVIGVAGI